MGIYSYGYKASKTPIGQKVVETVKNFFKGGKQKTTGQTINPFERKTMRSDTAAKMGELKVGLSKLKGGSKKLQTNIDEVRAAIREKARIKKASGGRVGKKFGGGIMTKKSNTQKIQEAFGPKKNKKLSTKQMKIAKLAGNPNKIDAADFKKLRNR